MLENARAQEAALVVNTHAHLVCLAESPAAPLTMDAAPAAAAAAGLTMTMMMWVGAKQLSPCKLAPAASRVVRLCVIDGILGARLKDKDDNNSLKAYRRYLT